MGVFDLEARSARRSRRARRGADVARASAAVAIDNGSALRGAAAQRLAGEVAFAHPAHAAARRAARREGRRRRPGSVAGSWAATFSWRSSPTRSAWRADVSGRACRPPSTAPSPASSCGRARSGGATRSAHRPGVDPGVDDTILHGGASRTTTTLCYAPGFRRRSMTLSNSGLPYPLHASPEGCGRLQAPGVPLGSLPGTTKRTDGRAERRRRVRLPPTASPRP